MSVTVPRGSTVQTTQARGAVNTPVRAPGTIVQKPTVDMVQQPHALVRILGHIIDRIELIGRVLVAEERGAFYSHSVTLAGAADTTISHGLQRTPVGWLITDITGAAPSIFRVSWSSTTLVLHNSDAVARTIGLKVW